MWLKCHTVENLSYTPPSPQLLQPGWVTPLHTLRPKSKLINERAQSKTKHSLWHGLGTQTFLSHNINIAPKAKSWKHIYYTINTNNLWSQMSFSLKDLMVKKMCLWWFLLCVNLDRLQCPVVWSNISLDVAVKVFL